jgi:predicted nucleic acid-binding protein
VIALVDACVAIDYLRGSDAARAALHGVDDLAASEITRYEILAGARDEEEERIEHLLALPHWLPVDEGVSRRAAALSRAFNASHSGIDVADYIVAATALEFGTRLLTRNVRHYPMLEGLRPAY